MWCRSVASGCGVSQLLVGVASASYWWVWCRSVTSGCGVDQLLVGVVLVSY